MRRQETRLIRPQILLLTALELCLVSCSTVPRPDTDIGVVNAIDHHVKSYNLSTDYDDQGNLLPSAVPKYRPALTVDDLNKNICTDPQGWANLKAYIRELRDALIEKFNSQQL